MTYLAAIKKAEGPIPDLRPPTGKIAFDFPESAIINGAVVFAFLALLIGRAVRGHRPLSARPVEPPIALARRALCAAEGPTIIQDCVQIVRRYLSNAYGIGWEGATNFELCEAFASHPRADAGSRVILEEFLHASDLARFASHEADQLAATCVKRALAVVEQLESWRIGARPPSPPVSA